MDWEAMDSSGRMLSSMLSPKFYCCYCYTTNFLSFPVSTVLEMRMPRLLLLWPALWPTL